MRLRVEDIFIQTDDTAVREYEVEVLQRLGHPERFHTIRLCRVFHRAVIQGGVRNGRNGVCDDGFPHLPRRF